MTSFNLHQYPKTPNDWASYWFYPVGVNPFPRFGKIPIVKYKEYRNKRIPDELFNEWIGQGKFNDNMCVMIGKITGHTDTLNYARKGLYLNFCDFDNELAIQEFCRYRDRQFTLEEMAKIVFVVQHSDDLTHAHVYWISSKPMPKRMLDNDKKILSKIKNNEIPAIEIKGAGDVAFCPGGYHESGNSYLPIGTKEIFHIEELNEHISNICRKFNLPVSDSERNKLRREEITVKSKSEGKQINLDSLDIEIDINEYTEVIPETTRNNTIFHRARRYYRKNIDILSIDNFKKIVHNWNEKYCEPPLPDFEIESVTNSIVFHYQQQEKDKGYQ
jgi:hypothetical protein